MDNRKPSYMDNIFDIPTITKELNEEFITLFKKNMLALINGYTQENFLEILTKQIIELENLILKMYWPIRVKDEIRMHLQLFSDCLLTNYNQGNKSLKIKNRTEVLFLIIKSLIPSMYVEEGKTKEDLQELRKNNLIKLVRSGKGDLIEVCDVLLQDFGIIEQRNIGAPQFCITELKWDSEKKEKIQISGCAWASVPLGVYRKDNINEIEEQKLFIENYPTMMMQLKISLEAYGFNIFPYDIGLGFKVEYEKETALKHIANYFKICLFTAGTALFDKKELKFIGGKQPMTKEFKISWDKEEPIITLKVINEKLFNALTNSKEESDTMLQGLMKGLGWKLNKPSGNVLTYTCTRPLWSLIHGLECWMSKTVLEDFGFTDFINSPTNYCTYVVTLQNKIGEKIWNSEPRPNSLVYRPDNPNFTEREDVGLHYHIHVYQGKKGDKEFEGGSGFAMGNYTTAAPLWQGFKIFQNFK